MTATLEGSIKRFIGLSSDRKPGTDPVAAGGEPALPVGSTFFESDTGAIYRWDNGVWRVPEMADQTNALLGHILVELQRIHVLLQLRSGIETGQLTVGQ